jgi:hypothetical protein
MHISELDEIDSSVAELISQARIELEQKRLQQRREQQIQELLQQIVSRIEPNLQKVEAVLKEFADDDRSETKAKLQQKAKELRQKLEEAPLLAEQKADLQFLVSEERLLEEQEQEFLNQWRQDLKSDLIDMIEEQQDFFSATDAAVAVKAYLSDLKAINALEEVVEALMNQINAKSGEGPVAKLRGSYEQTLTFIYNKAMENRSKVDRAPDVKPTVRHRKSSAPPLLYEDLAGKVIVFGGHDRLYTATRTRLRGSQVNLIWYTEQDGLQLASQGEEQVGNADLVIIVAGYASHSLTERAMEACRRANQTFEIVNTKGMTRILETIETGLKAQQLKKHFNGSSN